MGSKAPPTAWAAAPEGKAGKTRDQPPELPSSKAGALLRQVAGALQVPVSVLLNPPNMNEGVVERGSSVDHSATDLSHECAAVLQAYTRIRDPAERERLLKLLQEAAEKA